jgi:hypothetical protein
VEDEIIKLIVSMDDPTSYLALVWKVILIPCDEFFERKVFHLVLSPVSTSTTSAWAAETRERDFI